MASPEQTPKEIKTIVSQRKRAEFFLRALLPTRIHDANGVLKETHEQVAKGKGLIIISNHFSLRDGPQVFFSIPGKNDVMCTKTWTAPIAQHQYPVANFVNTLLQTHLDLKPVVTPDTKMKHPETRLGQGLKEYIDAATETLSDGGILVLFPQAERQSHLGVADNTTNTMSMLVNRMTKANVDNFVILPIGFGIDGAKNYTKSKTADIGKMYDVSIGKLWTREEMLDDAIQQGISLDQWAFRQLESLVPKEYLTEPT